MRESGGLHTEDDRSTSRGKKWIENKNFDRVDLSFLLSEESFV